MFVQGNERQSCEQVGVFVWRCTWAYGSLLAQCIFQSKIFGRISKELAYPCKSGQFYLTNMLLKAEVEHMWNKRNGG